MMRKIAQDFCFTQTPSHPHPHIALFNMCSAVCKSVTNPETSKFRLSKEPSVSAKQGRRARCIFIGKPSMIYPKRFRSTVAIYSGISGSCFRPAYQMNIDKSRMPSTCTQMLRFDISFIHFKCGWLLFSPAARRQIKFTFRPAIVARM